MQEIMDPFWVENRIIRTILKEMKEFDKLLIFGAEIFFPTEPHDAFFGKNWSAGY
jgi:hypothetical protein